MPITVDCSCGQRLMTADKYAGRRGKCPHCGEGVVFPHPEPVLGFASYSTIESDIGAVVPPARGPDPTPDDPVIALAGIFAGAGVAPVAPTPKARARGGLLSRSADPWYYRIMTACAFVCVGLGVLQFAAMTIFVLLHWSLVIDKSGLMGPFGLIGYSFFLLLLIMLMVAPMLLAVDMARSLRRIDANTSRASGEHLTMPDLPQANPSRRAPQ